MLAGRTHLELDVGSWEIKNSSLYGKTHGKPMFFPINIGDLTSFWAYFKGYLTIKLGV